MQKRYVEIVAQDPGMRDADGKVLTATVYLPMGGLLPGPMGEALHVVDFDASTGTMYRPYDPGPDTVVAPKNPEDLLADPGYHAMNAFAIAMRVLLRFEFALGRRIGWGIRGHQLKLVPHAFEDANAFYSPDLEALLFGYVRKPEPSFLCLSHDVVAHETAHALLDGLRDKFLSPSSVDQAALHEGFADIVALLSVFALPEIARHLIAPIRDDPTPAGYARKSQLTRDVLRTTALFGLAENMRSDASDSRVNALRRSVDIDPDPGLLNSLEYQEEHRRGELLVAAVMGAMLDAWVMRIQQLGGPGPDAIVDLGVVAEQGADIADQLLTMVIRAIDYAPPIHISFGDFLSAMLTADHEVRADDSRFRLRDNLTRSMAAYGIVPASNGPEGRWKAPREGLDRAGAHVGGLQSDPTEVFRHLWRNRRQLNLAEYAFTRVGSVRPCVRIAPDDGFQVRETVIECVQWLRITATELADYGLKTPAGMADDQVIVLEGGSTLILDEYGELKYDISNPLPSPTVPKGTTKAWNKRLQYLWDAGLIGAGTRSVALSAVHHDRLLEDDAGNIAAPSSISREAAEAWR